MRNAMEQTANNTAIFERFDKKRNRILLFCLIGAFVVGLAYTWSVLQMPFIQQLGGDSVTSTVVLCYTVTVVTSCMAPSVFGSFTKKLGPKKTVLLGTLLFGLGYIISGRTTNMALFFLSFGLGTGIGSGFIYPTIMGYMATVFPDKRGSVSGAIAGVYGGASIIWSPLLAGWIEQSGLAFALLIAGVIALVCIGAVSLMIEPVPEGYGEYKVKAAAPSGTSKTVRKTTLPDLTRGQMVKTSMFYVAIIAFAFGCTSGMMVISQVSSIMQKSFAMTATDAAFYVSVTSFMSMMGRFIWGWVTDHFNKYVTLSIICGLPILTMGLLVVSSSLPLTVACLAVTALCYGGFGSTITPITADLFGSKHVTENYGVMYLSFGFAGLIGPQLAVNFSSGGDYTAAYLVAAVISVIALIMALIVRRKVTSSLEVSA